MAVSASKNWAHSPTSLKRQRNRVKAALARRITPNLLSRYRGAILSSMAEKTTQASRLLWRVPLYAAIVALVIVTPIAFCEPDRFVFVAYSWLLQSLSLSASFSLYE
jgi:hypothetical protein